MTEPGPVKEEALPPAKTEERTREPKDERGGAQGASWSDVAKKGAAAAEVAAANMEAPAGPVMSFGTIGMDEPIPAAPQQGSAQPPPPPPPRGNAAQAAAGGKSAGTPEGRSGPRQQQGQAAQGQQGAQFAGAQPMPYGYGLPYGAAQGAYAGYPAVGVFPAAGYPAGYAYAAQGGAPYMQVAQGYAQAGGVVAGGPVPPAGATGLAASPATPAGTPGGARDAAQAPSPAASPATPSTLRAPVSKRIAIVNPNTKEEVKVSAPGQPASAAKPATTPASSTTPAPAPAAAATPPKATLTPPAAKPLAIVAPSKPAAPAAGSAGEQPARAEPAAAPASAPVPAQSAAAAPTADAVPAGAAAPDADASPERDASSGEARPKVRTLVQSFAAMASAKAPAPAPAAKPAAPVSPKANGRGGAPQADSTASTEVAKPAPPAAPVTPPPSDAANAAPAAASEEQAGGGAASDATEGPAAAPARPGVSPFAAASGEEGGDRKYSRDFMIGLRDTAAAKGKVKLMTEVEEIINDPSAPGYVPAAGGFERAMSRGDSRGPRRGGSERADSDWGSRGGRGGGAGGFRDGPRGGGGGGGPGGAGMARADSGRRGSGLPPGGVDSDRWARGGPLPPARGGGGPRRDLPALHKSASAFKVGLVLSDDPEEEAKQKAFKGILNKLTPDNFERLTQQLLDVGITEAKTLVGLISQIFDKALFEPHFCELYSMLCHTLQKRLPEFDDPTEPPADAGGEVKRRKLNFRRLLLNKCQEEFEKGDAAMNAVAQREAMAKERGDEEVANDDDGGDEAAAEGSASEAAEGGDQAASTGGGEEGDAAAAPKPQDAKAAALAARRAERAAAEAELKARRRMLGNIQFIGHLYRFGMLTENIMHSCIQRLLQDDRNPKLEDLECLCKLLSTIGEQLERGLVVKGQAGMSKSQLDQRQKEETARARKMMDVYFARIQRLVDNKALDSRLRFMLMDIMEQRQRGWAARRKAEGPMKIEEVHRAAKREADNVARADRGGRGGPGGRGGYGGDLPRRGSGVDHLRRDELPTAPMKAQLGARTASSEISLRPGGLGGIRGGGPGRGVAPERRSGPGAGRGTGGASEQGSSGGRAEEQQQQQQQQQDEPRQQPRRSGSEPGSAAGSARPSDAGGGVLSEDQVSGHLDSIVKLLFGQTDDTGETPEQLLKEVVGSADDVGSALQDLLRRCLDIRGVALEERLEKPKAFLSAQLEEGGCLDNSHLAALFLGPSGFVARLSDLVEDIPKAPVLTGSMLGDFVASGRLALRPIADAMLEDKPRGSGGGEEGGEEEEEEEGQDPPLVDAEQALPMVVALLSRWRDAAGDDGSAARAAWQSSGLEWRQLLPSFAREDADVSKSLERHGGTWLAA